ncbi:MAG: adenylate/guanylate cyclase domain-containing protein [Vampirovibrionales bacterium]|nr:adenylate/guanylate cyclase domain-containing protein [Vampirovibrionales bacterium]
MRVLAVLKSRWPLLLMAVLTLWLGVVFLLGLNELLFSLELESLAFRQRLFSSVPKDRSAKTPIRIVAFDAKTSASPHMKKLFGFPLSRSAPAYMVRFFKRTQPKAVIFDMSFNGGIHHDDLAGDRDLVESLRGTQAFISSLHFNKDVSFKSNFKTFPLATQSALIRNAVQVDGIENFPLFWRYYQYQNLQPPYPDLLENSAMRFVSAHGSIATVNPDAVSEKSSFKDASGDSRRWAPFSLYGGYTFPTLPLAAVLIGEKNGEQNLKLSKDGRLSWSGSGSGGWVDLGRNGIPFIKWYGHGLWLDKPVYPEISFWDVIVSEIVLECRENHDSKPVCAEPWLPRQPLLRPESFNGRYVLIGFTIPTAGDTHKTIYGLRYSGIYILANTLDNLLSRDFVYEADWRLNWGGTLLLPTLLMLIIWRFRSLWMSLLMAITLGLGYFVLCIIAYDAWNLWLYSVYPLLTLFAFFVGFYLYRYLQEQKQRQQLRYAFGKYVSPGVMQWIEKHPERVKLGGERREMTFLFCDIRGFTAFADSHSPEEVQALLSRYFSKMNAIVLHHYKGTINKLMGDAIMAYWGFPIDSEDQALLAVQAALAMRDASDEWRKDAEHPPIDIGIGVHTGEAMVGNIGSEDFMDFTVIGDAVNIAARLESLNKEMGTRILVSASTYEKLKGQIAFRDLGTVDIRGKGQGVQVFEPLKAQ